MSKKKSRKPSYQELAERAREWKGIATIRLDEIGALKDRIKRLSGPFTCHHAPEYVGGACAACHVNLIEAIESIGRQCQGGTIKEIVDRALATVHRKK